MTQPVCVVTGVGPGTGSALSRRFAAGGYRVAMLARNVARLTALEQELPGARGYVCDVTDPAQVDATMAAIEGQLGAPSVLIYNAVGGGFGSFLDIDPAMLERNFQVNAMGLLHAARRLAPAMMNGGEGRDRCDRQHLGPTRQSRIRRVRADQGGTTHPGRSDGERPWAKRGACRIRGD